MDKTRAAILYLVAVILLWPCGIVSADDIPAPQGYVNDFAAVITPEYRDKLSSIISELERKTTAEIAVVTAGSIAPYGETQYARMIFDSWKIGKKGKDNGVLVLLAVKERRWRIETGYGVEGILTDSKCGAIGRRYMVPYFKKGQYAEGLYYGTLAIARTIADDAKVSLETAPQLPAPGPETGGVPPGMVSAFLFIFFFVWNLPWPFVVGLAFTAIFAGAFFQFNPLFGWAITTGYLASLFVRFIYFIEQPPHKRKSFFGQQTYGGRLRTSGGSWSTGGFGRGGFGGGGFGGGFGGGGGGGGGAGGGF